MSEHNPNNPNGPNGQSQSASRPSGPEPAGEGPFEGREHSHEHGPHSHFGDQQRCLELCPICRAADILRASAPPELREQWQTVQREALLTTRALIEHYLARLDDDQEPEERSRVEDIPIL